MNKLSKEKRDKLIMTAFVAVAVIGILYVFVLGAQKDKLAMLNAQISSAKDKMAKAERLVKSKDTLDIQLSQNRQELDHREQDMAPTGQYYYWFLKLLEEFRKKEGLESSFVVDITQPEFIEAGLMPQFPYKAAAFTVRVNGQFQDVGRFIADFENAYPYFRIQNLHMQPEGPGTTATLPNVTASSRTDGKLIIQLRIVTLIKSATT
jgi:Tfp pilus assembly protein PilO